MDNSQLLIVSRLLENGKLKYAREALLILVERIRGGKKPMSATFRRQLVRVTRELSLLDILENAVTKNPKKVDLWLNSKLVSEELGGFGTTSTSDAQLTELEARINAGAL